MAARAPARTLDRYLADVAKVPLLNAEGETALAKRIEAADTATLVAIRASVIARDEIARCGAELTLPLERRFVQRVEARLRAAGDAPGAAATLEAVEAGRRASDAAKGEFATANLRFVVSLARKHMNQGFDFVDLVQEGNAGLMRAVDKFDYRRGYRFSTYAMWWVRQSMSRAIADKGSTIRLPVHLVESRRKVQRATQRFVQAQGREPTEKELMIATGLEAKKIRAVTGAGRSVTSLDAPVGAEAEAHVGDFVTDRDEPTPEERVARAHCSMATRRLLKKLTPREQRVLQLRFGLDEKSDHTLEEVGRELDLTRERIRQIEVQALKKLKVPAELARLRSYLG